MSAQMLDGKALAKRLREELKEKFAAFTAEHSYAPTVAIFRIGADEASAGYARAIEKTCQGVGAGSRMIELPSSATQAAVEATLETLNADPAVHGIMILEPVPDHIDHAALIDRMDPRKDVDGVHPLNAGRLLANRPPFLRAGHARRWHAPARRGGRQSFKGKHAVIVGRSDIVGKPMALLLLHRHCTVTITHSRTVDLPGVCRSADILCLAIGRAEMVKADWVKPGAIVVDFGTTYTDERSQGRLRSGRRGREVAGHVDARARRHGPGHQRHADGESAERGGVAGGVVNCDTPSRRLGQTWILTESRFVK
jgi:methylenetetrahydrofolate dehydrogenase (NADP+)/methenyltetrahydrofolate cyclohydrolase